MPTSLKTLRPILICSAALVVSFIASGLITLIAWNIQIEGRAFHCTDATGFGDFWQDIDIHRQAGDKLSPGWTWQEIKTARLVYEVIFFALWITASIVPFLVLFGESQEFGKQRSSKNNTPKLLY